LKEEFLLRLIEKGLFEMEALYMSKVNSFGLIKISSFAGAFDFS
jgi:hypothetical protein